MTRLADLTEQQVLALAISNEEEDGRIYADLGQLIATDYPDSARIFFDMAEEEDGHRRHLIDVYVERFGNHIPLIRRQDIAGFPQRRAAWQIKNRNISAMRAQAHAMEQDAARFYREAAARCTDAGVRRLLGDLAIEEDRHTRTAQKIATDHLSGDKQDAEDAEAHRRLILQVVQPGLVGLMDGSVSTLAPVFAAAFATHDPHEAFLVGMAAAVGAGISIGFAEALSDDGKLSGRGAPLLRGVICGLMTTGGGILHTLPFLISDFRAAFGVAVIAVLFELLAISWIRWRYQDTPFGSAIVQIVLGGALVFAAGILIGVS